MLANDDSPDNDRPVGQPEERSTLPGTAFRSELIRAAAPAIYGRSWIPYVRLLLLVIAASGTIILVHDVL
jgi:hypothetical protein